MSKQEYARSIEKLELREGKSDEELTDKELKVFRTYIGKLNWLASNRIPDLSIYVMDLAHKQKKGKTNDMRNFTIVLYKVLKRNNKIVFKRVAKNEKMCVIVNIQ